MPTYNYDERVQVVKSMETTNAARCPRCGASVEQHRLQTTQDKLLKRPGKPLYRCSNPKCLLECTPMSYMTIAPTGPSPKAGPVATPPPGMPERPPTGS
jgi:hypothetical protein